MKILVAHRYGRPSDLEVVDVSIPEPGRGQILVRIEAASISSTDLRMVTGVYREMLALEFHYIPGNGFAGTVTLKRPGSDGDSRYLISAS